MKRTRFLHWSMFDRPKFWDKVDRGDVVSCWIWRGARIGGRYGSFGYRVRSGVWRSHQAHRIAYALAFDYVPAGRIVMHVCDNPLCVRPDHLRLGTQAENLADMRSKGRNDEWGWKGRRRHVEAPGSILVKV